MTALTAFCWENFIPHFSAKRNKKRCLREHNGAVTLLSAQGSHCCVPEVQSSLPVTNLGNEQILYESQKATVLLQDKTGTGYWCMNRSYRYPFDMLLSTVLLCID